MLSAANLDFSGLLVDLICIIFFGIGLGYSLIVGVIHLVQKKTKTFGYYLRTFLISGIIGLGLGTLIIMMWALSL
ncbi:hypothetical protein [Sphingobacterium sp. HMA12]|uniref:hypothetical protein n=1 Tax=Sphingobacterium sp. HMA12 TaxID=2050894 RepID=UPI000CEA1374|nr:hypothetical protein [Sphingobacterium sp. HMA12]